MAAFAAGDVVTVPFPASASRDFKVRPALVLAPVSYAATTDYVLCAITSQVAPDPAIVFLAPGDMAEGSLHRTSYVRPTYLFTVHGSLIVARVGRLGPDAHRRVVARVLSAVRAGAPRHHGR